jgi:hypothetical protein
MKAKHLTHVYFIYQTHYKWRFNGIAFAISLSVFAALRPYLLKQTGGYIQTEDAKGSYFTSL